jgi:hypothetical protein
MLRRQFCQPKKNSSKYRKLPCLISFCFGDLMPCRSEATCVVMWGIKKFCLPAIAELRAGSGSRAGFGSVNSGSRSEDLYPYRNVADAEHWLYVEERMTWLGDEVSCCQGLLSQHGGICLLPGRQVTGGKGRVKY